MRLTALSTACLLASSSAAAQVHGVAVQVNEGKIIPTADQLQMVLQPKDFVRDVLGWNKVDADCKLRTDPSLPIKIPSAMSTLYDRVAAAGGRNFVTLAFNNTHCGQAQNSGAKAFPDTDLLRAEFAAYAVRVVKQVPAIGGLSIWNEMNGTWKGGYSTKADMLTAYCKLANQVIGEVRKVDRTIPIAIGATVGWNVDDWFIDMFDTYGCVGKGDATIWLDVHPYLTGKKVGHQTDWQAWDDAAANIRAHGVANPFIASEWGASAAYNWSTAHPTGNYIQTFESKVTTQDPAWAGSVWFQLLYDRKSPHAALLDMTGTMLTTFGSQYVKAARP